MRTTITNKVRRLNSLKLWSAITGVALTIALVLTFLPMQISTEGLLSIDLSYGVGQEKGVPTAYGQVEKSGCVVRKGNCQIRLDFYLEPDDPRYNDKYLHLVDTTSPEWLAGYKGKVDEFGIPIDQEDYDTWFESLPRVWVNTPFHSHFIYLPPTFTNKDIEDAISYHLPNFYLAFQDRWDEVQGGMRHGWATETRIRPIDYSKSDTPAEFDARVAECQSAIDSLTEFSYKPEGTIEGETFPATEINIGPGAIDRATTFTQGFTLIDNANPANDTGTIDAFEIWAQSTMSGTNKVGTFYGSGTSYTNRDGQTIGSVTAGSKQTFTLLDIDVTTGDLAGIYYSVGAIEEAGTGGADMYYKAGDQFGAGAQTYGQAVGDVISLYGTGETAGEEPPGDPDNLTDTAHNGVSIDLEWTKGTGADYTLIRYRTDQYPTGTGDGTLGYNSTSNTTTVGSLDYGQIYYFRAWAWNSTTTLYSDGTSDRTCFTDPNVPTSFVVTETTNSSIALSWVLGTGSDKTMVRYRDDEYPTGTSDGTQAYFDTGTSVNVTSLDSGQIYYFRAWSYDTDSGYYDSYAQLTESTIGVPTAITQDATDIACTTARINGKISDDGGDECEARFRWRATGAWTIAEAGRSDVSYYSANEPKAFYYSGTYNRTYIAYSIEVVGNNNDSICILYFDHDTKTFSSPETLATGVHSDYHGSPTVLVSSNGKIHVFWSHDNGDYIYYRRSTSAEDISSWEDVQQIASSSDLTGSQSILLSDDTMLVSFRGGDGDIDKWQFVKSTNGGVDWSAIVTLVDFPHYCYGRWVKDNFTDRIHLLNWDYNSETFKAELLTYAYSDDAGDTWKRVDGSSITLPMTEVNMTAVNYGRALDNPDAYITVPAIDNDADHYPYMLYRTPNAVPVQVRWVYWNGSSWVDALISDLKTYTGDLKVISSTEIYAYLENYYELNRFKWNGSAWAYYDTIETGADPTGACHAYIMEQPWNSLSAVYMWGVIGGTNGDIHLAFPCNWTYTEWQNTLTTDSTFYEDLTDLDPDTEYEFQTQAKNSAGEGEWSATAHFTICDISNTPSSNDFGILAVDTTGNTAINYFTLENTGDCAVDVTIQGTDVTGGDDTWTLSDTATPGENTYGLYAGLDDDDDLFDVIVKKTETYNTLVSDLAEDATQDWGLKIYMPTSLSGYGNQEMAGTVTLVASASS